MQDGGAHDDRTTKVGVPAVPRSARLVRILAADLGSRAGLRVDEIDELRLAVDEAFFALVDAAEPGSRLEVEGRWDGDGVELRLAVDLAAADVDVAPVAAVLLAALVEEHGHSVTGRRATFRLRKAREQ